jgi:outer membrane cobalamin receptor
MTVSAARGAGRDFFFPEYASDPTDPNAERGADGRPTDGNARSLDGFDAAMLAGRAFYKSLSVQWHLNRRDKIVPTAAYDAVFGDARNRLRDTRGFVELKFEPKLGKSTALLARVHANLYDFDGFVPNAPNNVDREGFKGRWLGGELRAIVTPADPLRITVGAEAMWHATTHQTSSDDVRGIYASNDTPFVQVAPYLLGDVMPSKRVKLEAGARLDYFSNLSKFDPGAAFSPRLAAIFKPWKGGNVKVMGGKAFRAPSVYELYGQGLGQARSVDLQPEQVWSGEVEVSHKLTETLTAAVAGYANYVTGLIELVPTGVPNELRYANSNAPVIVGGGEAETCRTRRSCWAR